MHDKKFMITKALKFGAYGTFENFGIFLLLMILAFIERAIMLGTMGLFLGAKLLRGFTDYQLSTAEKIGTIFSLLSFKVFFVIVAVYSLFMISNGYISALLTQAGLEIFEGRQITINSVRVNWLRVWHLILGMFLYCFMFVLGLSLFIIPGIFIGVTYGYYRFFIIEKNMRPLEALRASARVTQGSRWYILVLWCILSILNALGLYFWGLGLLITLPISLLAHVYVYKRLLSAAGSR